jgi:hypothetical protein
MNKDELEVAKAAAEGSVAGLLKSLHELILNTAGPPTKEAGEWFREIVAAWRSDWRERRFANCVKVAFRSVEILEVREAPRRVVEPKVWVPLLEQASLETDEFLQERWAALLASAADASAPDITPDYGDILKALTPGDVQLLDWLTLRPPDLDPNDPVTVEDGTGFTGIPMTPRPRATVDSVLSQFGMSEAQFELTCSRLERLGICDVGRYVFPTRLGVSGTGPRRYDSIALRPLGVAFVQACQP